MHKADNVLFWLSSQQLGFQIVMENWMWFA